ncbi:alpha/beta hydrolase-fold protein [Algoriphagus sp. PAP.12]|uniref:alpha/beta hydrolase-fold protein n=1 Tax=Algoriphagus sp. PAP.12 TaxID=2996678 RepID=UPI00227B811C|nr:alpha/beta hydrolase-fold protein [Algoriphagus sp. PAP.12]
MNKPILTFLFVLFGITQLFSQDIDPITIGTKHKIHSTILNEEREYWINLPESYEDEGTSYKKYPLLIILDGNLHFQSITGAVNYMSSGYNGNLRIPEMIVVAIQNVNRRRDFTPDKIVTTRPNDSGGGENFLSFMENELIPELDQNYRTAPYRILFGHSLGGLLATHAYMKENTKFNSFIAVDPSFGTWDDETMDQKLDTLTENSFDRYIYIATANWGKRNIRNRDRHVRLFESLNSKCEGEFPAKLEYFEDENHGSVPQIAFYNGISAIFEGYGIYYRDIESKDQLDEHFKALSNRLSFDFYPPEQLVNRIGYTFLQSRNDVEKAKAVDFFILNTEYYPNSYNAFDSLGEAYEMLGNFSKAIENYQKSLALNPDNEHAANRISNLKENM